MVALDYRLRGDYAGSVVDPSNVVSVNLTTA